MLEDLVTGTCDAVVPVVHMMRVLSDTTRLRVLGLLQGGERNVTTLCTELRLAQPTVSHHLGLLRSAGLVHNRRAGKQVFYSLNADTVISTSDGEGLAISAGVFELRLSSMADATNGESHTLAAGRKAAEAEAAAASNGVATPNGQT